MKLTEIMGDCPNLENMLRGKDGRIARIIESALAELSADLHAPDKPAGNPRKVKFVLTLMPIGEDRCPGVLSIDDPTFILAKRPAEGIPINVADSTRGDAQIFAQNVEQTHINQALDPSHGLKAEDNIA